MSNMCYLAIVGEAERQDTVVEVGQAHRLVRVLEPPVVFLLLAQHARVRDRPLRHQHVLLCRTYMYTNIALDRVGRGREGVGACM